MKTKSINGRGLTSRTITTTYDPKGRFATTETNALGQSETRKYDERYGTVTELTGPNGLKSYWRYNAFGVPYIQQNADGSKTEKNYVWMTDNSVPGARYRITTESISKDAASATTTTEYFDYLERVIKTSTTGFSGTTSVDTVYNHSHLDGTGNVVGSTNPGTVASKTRPYITGHLSEKISYTYDLHDRPLTVTYPGNGGSESYSYDGLVATVTDPEGKTTIHEDDPFGRRIRTDRGGSRTKHHYDAQGNLDKTTVSKTDGSDAISTTLNSNLVGNKVWMVDPDLGRWEYDYNAAGELTYQKDAKGQEVVMEYDTLGRLVTRTDRGVDGNEDITEWKYDSAPGAGKGKLHQIIGPGSYRKTITYTGLGQIAGITETLPDDIYSNQTKNYITHNSYDAANRLDVVTYPISDAAEPVKVKHSYHSSGALQEIKDATTNERYWTLEEVNADGKIKSELYGNGVRTKRVFDSLGRLKTIKTGVGGDELQNLEYNFSAVGNLDYRKDHNLNLTETFRYDNLYRLQRIESQYRLNDNPIEAGNIISADDVIMGYDIHGNMETKGGKGYEYSHSSHKHAVSKYNGQDYTYDQNGNMHTGGGRTITWATFNKPTRVVKGETTVDFAYSADRARILKQNGIKKTWYINGLYERRKNGDGTEAHKYMIKAGGATVATITKLKAANGQWTDSNKRYVHTDHLGSIDTLSNIDGSQYQKLSFGAWGDRRGVQWRPGASALTDFLNDIGSENNGFTGHEHDDEIGLINMKGRLYDAELGRFISADPFVQAPNNSQSYNRYSYVFNNPLSITDPSGYISKSTASFITIVVIVVAVVFQQYYLAAYSQAIAGGATVSAAAAAGAPYIAGAALWAGATSYILSGGSGTSAFIAAASVYAFYGIGQHISSFAGTVVAHGVVGGVSSELQGGKFSTGFKSAAISKLFSKVALKAADATGTANNPNHAVGAVISASIGGTVSEISGGKFANGAVTAAFGYLFNAATPKSNQNNNKSVKLNEKTVICQNQCRVLLVSGTVSVGPVSHEQGEISLFDSASDMTHKFEYSAWGGGPPGVAAAATVELGIVFPESTIGAFSGNGWSVNFLAAGLPNGAPVGGTGSIFGSTSSGDRLLGGTIGFAGGAGVSLSLMRTSTSYVGSSRSVYPFNRLP